MANPAVVVRREADDDEPAIRRVHESAFPSLVEAKLVDELRAGGKLSVSLVAVLHDSIVAHIAFSPVQLESVAATTTNVGLAPVAVCPPYQQQGIGSQVIRAGLDACRHAGFGFVVVLGDTDYYSRFDFQQASRYQLSNEYGADDSFQVQKLVSGSIPRGGGLVKYAPEFAICTT